MARAAAKNTRAGETRPDRSSRTLTGTNSRSQLGDSLGRTGQNRSGTYLKG
jgi:hypothetical protein